MREMASASKIRRMFRQVLCSMMNAVFDDFFTGDGEDLISESYVYVYMYDWRGVSTMRSKANRVPLRLGILLLLLLLLVVYKMTYRAIR